MSVGTAACDADVDAEPAAALVEAAAPVAGCADDRDVEALDAMTPPVGRDAAATTGAGDAAGLEEPPLGFWPLAARWASCCARRSAFESVGFGARPGAVGGVAMRVAENTQQTERRRRSRTSLRTGQEL